MSKMEKNEEIEKMVSFLERVKSITKEMQNEIELAQEYTKEVLHKMVRINKEVSNVRSKKCCEDMELYKTINSLLFKYYVFNDIIDGGVRVHLKNEAFMKNDKNSKVIKALIADNPTFSFLEKVVDSIEEQRNLFKENLLKLRNLREENSYVELDEFVNDYIGTLSFDNECSLNRFLKALNTKLKELNKR